MRWTVIAVGKPALPWAKSGISDYLDRLTRSQRVECLYLRDGTAEQVTRRMLEASDGALRILLDERGKARRSTELADWIKARELDGVKHVALLIGGANGHSAELKAAVRESWTLSPMTLQHELALVVLLEQLYRAYSILRGEPYHRE
jgi:23S rRNA (pseudouridine1915-N3)-methyltransferase